MMKLMLGNEAVARGAYEAGCHVVSSYPGTPSTEITEFATRYPEISCEWATNEKVAAEVTYGAAITGARAMTCMKHVGVNVAADPLFTASYTGIRGGMVVVCADDPAMHSSQNEQDSRYYALSAHIPMLEPSDSQECKDFTALAFELSEKYDTPVFLRIVTRIAHARSSVILMDRQEVPVQAYAKDMAKYVMMPAMARRRHPVVEQRENDMAAHANQMAINRIEMDDPSLGIICAGSCYQYVKEALPHASVLKLGMVHPLPMELIRTFAGQVRRLVVIEELEPIIEREVAAQGIPVEGKNLTGYQGELSVGRIRAAFGMDTPGDHAVGLPIRPPALCPGCPHRSTFDVLKQMKLRVMGDIGCYTLGALQPLDSIDACLCMGASIGMAFGAEKAQGKEFSRKTVAVIGDSTFLHSGVTGLIDAVYNGGSITVMILDNRITGMTGHQQNPATGKDIKGDPAPEIDLEALSRACGVSDVTTVDPFDRKALRAALTSALANEKVSVIIAKRPCALILTETKPPVHIEACRNCGTCLRFGCPALRRVDRAVVVDQVLCVGCGNCVPLCPFGCIKEEGAV